LIRGNEEVLAAQLRIDWTTKTLLLILLAFFFGAEVARATVVTDGVGRTVLLPQQVNRIVSLAPSITEIIFAVGAGERLVGVSQFSNYPPQASSLTKVGSYVQPSIEKILALRPDLVIGIKDGNPAAVVERLTELKIPTFIVNPKNLEEVVVTIKNIGRVIGAGHRSAVLAKRLTLRIQEVDQRVSEAPRPKVFFQIGFEPIVSAGRGTFIDALIRRAGGYNVAGSWSGYPHLNVEQILMARPEIIFTAGMADNMILPKVKHFWQQWPDIPAVKKNEIHTIDADICYRPSPRLIEGLEALARKIHPERF
jgi:iron complex transport system substrate-binding protein